ncbi:hypothetical protein [Adhaeribacter pallidiroseus]|uniref:Uncharacterized protein n=1 Tax=Adhaeribacter pallidiroseus TaxID=2072847 RepID=A0A369QEG7_9BACT|nr:hypothetical protein [Adhaeribacter pallidiroseus]RDC63311.1 hypothetical protein AHMF7616_01913 [Adhaeribacter pallidiroseus]
MMQGDYNPLETATETITKELYGDFKKWALSVVGPIQKVINHLKKIRYYNLFDLLSDISNNSIRNGQLVEIECKFSSFGPFLKQLYISPISGSNTLNRLGPTIESDNFVFSLFAQTTTHLTPVGLYPAISNTASQVQLYPSNAEALGFFGPFPGVNNMVPSFNALIKPEFLNDAHKPCKLTGRIRFVNQHNFIQAGFKLEEYEAIRSMNNIWFLDATKDESECSLIENEVKQLWGGLYSAGHLEIEGSLPLTTLVDNYINKLGPLVKNIEVVQNTAGNKEVNLFGIGFRMVQHINKSGLYALHYDIDIGTNYSKQKEEFDNLINAVHSSIIEACQKESAKVLNPNDLDFNYSNSSESFRILESMGAKNIKDPLAIAIRKWTQGKTTKN